MISLLKSFSPAIVFAVWALVRSFGQLSTVVMVACLVLVALALCVSEKESRVRARS